MKIIYNSPSTDVLKINQFGKRGEDSYRSRKGHVTVWAWDDGKIDVDPINAEITEPGEQPCDMFQLDVWQARKLALALLEAAQAYEDQAE